MEALLKQKLHGTPVIPEFVTQVHTTAPFCRYLSSKMPPSFQSELCITPEQHSRCSVTVYGASVARVTGEAAGSAEARLIP